MANARRRPTVVNKIDNKEQPNIKCLTLVFSILTQEDYFNCGTTSVVAKQKVALVISLLLSGPLRSILIRRSERRNRLAISLHRSEFRIPGE